MQAQKQLSSQKKLLLPKNHSYIGIILGIARAQDYIFSLNAQPTSSGNQVAIAGKVIIIAMPKMKRPTNGHVARYT